ncbi:hypothetical protein [Bacillus atrophaeus]|uniref:hypothetical protein n=1 Tax=Bacillus atrophaeus TaxID=1452 RepID=UPI002DBA1CCA|nr:hypothetical protein [Bacillus atrophaeus]MEC0695966.1 hypothetical protein [Bacillus atrophaeus]
MQSIMKLTTGKLAALVFLVGALALALPVLPNTADDVPFDRAVAAMTGAAASCF